MACGEGGYRDLNATYWYRVMVAYKLNNPMIVLVDGREDELNDIDGQRGRREARRNDSVIAKRGSLL